jgi:SAM-dependent methyltransferase
MLRYLRGLYQRTMRVAYARAHRELIDAIRTGGDVLDCGAGGAHLYRDTLQAAGLPASRYHGIEYDADAAASAAGLDVRYGDLNRPLPFADNAFRCVVALSVVEHLSRPCLFLRESHRVLAPAGRLVLLTPNISTYFTAAQILAGRMPSTGPTPDSADLIWQVRGVRLDSGDLSDDFDEASPRQRHLVVFSYLVLRRYLTMIGYRNVRGYGFGVYPFPNAMQPVLERLDPYHAHQMVFVAEK